MESILTQLLTHRVGVILQITSIGFVAILKDQLDHCRPDDTEEFFIEDVSEPDISLVKIGARFDYKTGYRRTPSRKDRAAWLEFEGSSLHYDDRTLRFVGSLG
jgi:hypothetical protein